VLPAFGERGKGRHDPAPADAHPGLKPWRPFHKRCSNASARGERLLGAPATKEAVLEPIHRGALVHDPGEAAVYGDLDFILLGAVIEPSRASRSTVRDRAHLPPARHARDALRARRRRARSSGSRAPPLRRHRGVSVARADP
jgi:hypothetical protein